MEPYAPRIVCFSCNFGWGYLSEREQLAAAVDRWVPVACSGKVDAVHILRAFQKGADGVLILGCPEGECHFQDGSYQTKKKTFLLQQVLAAHGIEPERLRMVLSVDPEGAGIADAVGRMAEAIRPLGPVALRPAPRAAAS
ncbi:MAG: hypothetical protein Kow0092_04760 [Deferrisomatales bacterium]